MISQEISGNLIHAFDNSEVQLLVHGCNCFNTMGAGIAKVIKERYPQAYSADLGTKKGDRSKLGKWSSWSTGDRTIINLYTQYYYGYMRNMDRSKPIVDYDAIYTGFSSLNEKYKNDGKIVGIPKIGAGLARGDWSKIESIINEVTPDIDIKLYVLIGNGK